MTFVDTEGRSPVFYTHSTALDGSSSTRKAQLRAQQELLKCDIVLLCYNVLEEGALEWLSAFWLVWIIAQPRV